MAHAKPIRDFKDLDVRQRGFSLAVEVHRLTACFPSDERFGITSQLRRAAVAIPANIAEGYGRGSRQDYIRFLRIARGSGAELETQLLLSTEFDYVTPEQAASALGLLRDVFAILSGLLKALDREQ